MEVMFDATGVPEQLQDVVDDFVVDVLAQLRNEVISSIPKERLTDYCYNMLAAPFVQWTISPILYSPDDICKVMQVGIVCYKQDGKFIFTPSKHYNLPGTRTPFYVIMKYLSYGDGNLRGIHQIQNVFNLYSQKIDEYWSDYLTARFSEQGDEEEQ